MYFGGDGEVRLNRKIANWQRAGLDKPYGRRLIEFLGEPIPMKDMWNPDAVLSLDAIEHATIDQQRVDKAAALQLVFEDGLFHIIGGLIRRTGASRLVFTGGTALNCVANMRLLDEFDPAWYRRNLGHDAQLELWVPPIAGDSGAPPGAAYAFAMMHGARPGRPMTHAFHCGEGPRAEEVDAALASREGVAELRLGNVTDGDMERVADLLAHIVANDGVVGLVHGPAETGPRALGHRSILANACNADTLETINATVKHRERIRPLAPMATRAAAEELFELSPGASALDHVAYNFMVLTARVRPLARELVPAVVHEDGTARLQIVRPADDPLAHAFLKAVGVRAGVEVAVNTSLNVGAPICQTAEQALTTLSRARHMDGIVIVDQDGAARLVWMSRTRPEAARKRVAAWLADQDIDLQAAQLAHQASGSR